MLKYSILALLILLNSFTIFSARLSEQARVSILTCSPGAELYSTFGHTAIRVVDPKNEIDLVFNFGTFDFNTPNFYLKFARGRLNYMLSVARFEHFLHEYRFQSRSVIEQELNLNYNQVNDIFSALLLNAQPENRYYHYHFFFDNCATRVRDAVVNQFADSVIFNASGQLDDPSFREALYPYVKDTPWLKLGLNIILGQPTDDLTNSWTVQFLPDHLMWKFADARLQSTGEPVVSETRPILDFGMKEEMRVINPAIWLWALSILLLWFTWREFKAKYERRWINVVLFTLTSLIGVLIVFLWFFTFHTVTGSNWHLLWANPLHLVFVFNPGKILARTFKIIRYILLILLVITILSFAFLPQYMPVALLPVWLLLAARAFCLIFTRGHEQTLQNKC